MEVIGQLREHCPWMGALTHASLVEYLIEEAYEVAETIETEGPDEELRAELGDVLLQVVLHARLGQERGAFGFDDVARGLVAKMVRRNPHVFRPDGTLQDSFPATVEEIVRKWDAVKQAERPGPRNPFEGIPQALPALARAQKSVDRAARAQAALPAAAPIPETEDALGDWLLAVVRSAHMAGFDAERALRGAVRRYQQDNSQEPTPS
ncbi:MazG nucleotide pyrophosphohydrolase domain-containing protein [Arthrobacter sp. AD-310]